MGTISNHDLSIVPDRISNFPAPCCRHPGQRNFHPSWKPACQAHSFPSPIRPVQMQIEIDGRIIASQRLPSASFVPHVPQRGRYHSKNENPTRRQAYGFVSGGGQEKTEQRLGFILEIEGQISHMTREHYRKMSLNDS